MCGHVGIYSSDLTMKHKECLSYLLYLDTWRGRDSTGVAAIRHNADTQTLKSTVPGYEFTEGPALHHHLHLNDFCWIGHNRAGTIGKNIKSNAHPFKILDRDGSCLLVGAHNGTLKNKHALTDHVAFGTDSEALFNEIAFNGIKEAVAKIEGSWALVWYDHVSEELHFLRNKERTLFYAYEKGHKTLVWASELWMIKVAMSRAGLEIEDDKVFDVSEDTLYTFPVPMKQKDVLTLTKKGGVEGKPPYFFQGNTERWGTGGQEKLQTFPPPQVTKKAREVLGLKSGTTSDNAGSSQTDTTKNSSGSPFTDTDKEESNVVAISDSRTFKGWKGAKLSAKELRKILDEGCSWCELEVPKIGERFAFLADKKTVCQKCLDGTPEPDSLSKITIH